MKISELIFDRVKIKNEIKVLENVIKSIDQGLMEELENEANKSFETDNYIVKVIQKREKVFDLEKIFDLLGDTRTIKKVNKETGEIKKMNLFKPVATAIKEYLQEKSNKGELTPEQITQYKASFHEKLSEPFIMVEKKIKKIL